MTRRPLTPDDAAALVQKATNAMLDALAKCGAIDNPTVAGAAIGGLVGTVAGASDDPGMMLGRILAVASGIMDGSLLDP